MTESVTLTIEGDEGADVNRVIPRRLGPVVLEEEIGRGAMGVVFRGRHEILGRDVAVKLLLHKTTGLDFERFRTEARIAAAVRHPHLTLIHHADVADGVPYLVMDLINGPSLAMILKQVGALPFDAALEAALVMCEGVAALHESGIVHRDIKPRNTLLDRNGNVFVTDFGLALSPTSGKSMALSDLAGTPRYMAPEMFDGLVSPRSDVYALGISTFEFISGRAPFVGSLVEIQNQHAGTALPIEALERLGVAPRVIDVIERATHKNATFRYKSADYYRQALEACTEEARRAGARTILKDLAARSVTVEAPRDVEPPMSNTPTTTYFDLLGQIADKRRHCNVSVVCPMDEPASSGDEVPRDAVLKEGIFQVDFPCVRCTFNLRGMNIVARCPECGEPISRSAGPPRLMFADLNWLARIQRGLTMILAAPAIFILCVTLKGPFERWATRDWQAQLLAFAADHSKPYPSYPHIVDTVSMVSVIVLPYLIATVGVFFATTGDASTVETCRRTVWRYTARAGALLSVGTIGLLVGYSHTPDPMVLVLGLGACVAAAGFFFWLASLAKQNLDTKRAIQARIAIAALACSSFLVVLAYITWPKLDEIMRLSPQGVIGIGLGSVVLVGAYLWSTVMTFRRLIKQEGRLAATFLALRR